MTSEYRTFTHFSETLLDPFFEIYEILRNKEHARYQALLEDLNSLDQKKVETYISENRAQYDVHDGSNDPISKRAFYFLREIWRDIAQIRIQLLKTASNRPRPYDSVNLDSLEVDKSNLVSTKDFEIYKGGFKKDDLVYTLCPVIEQSNSSYWLSQAIVNVLFEAKILFRVRLDPFIEIPAMEFAPVQYRMHIHGKPLDWDRVSRLREDEFGSWLDEKDYNRIGTTDYVWSPKNHSVHYTCEELPKRDYSGLKASRYFHAIIDKRTGGISHCDGAIRLYDDDEIAFRYNSHVKNADVRKIGNRIKVFQFESNDNNGKELTRDMFSLLVMNFYVWNNDVISYFM